MKLSKPSQVLANKIWEGKKEILIIFVLAVLATGLSWFIAWSPPFWPPQGGTCYYIEDNYQACPEMALRTVVRGFPLPYREIIPSGAKGSDFPQLLLPIFFILDILIYFILFWVCWIILRSVAKGVKK